MRVCVFDADLACSRLRDFVGDGVGRFGLLSGLENLLRGLGNNVERWESAYVLPMHDSPFPGTNIDQLEIVAVA